VKKLVLVNAVLVKTAVAAVFPFLVLIGWSQQAAPLMAQPAGEPAASRTLAQRIGHTDPAQFRASPAVHGGPGRLQYMSLLASNDMDTNIYFLHRGIIEPRSGIGQHFHNQCEEMFIIFDGECEFTIDGRTSLLKGPAGAPCRLGHSHAIYNNTDKPVEWMNINISAVKGLYDAFDLNDGRVGATLDPIPQFMSMSLDRARLPNAVEGLNGGGFRGGSGPAKYRRALDTTVFQGPWAYVDHLLLEKGASTGAKTDPNVGEFYYVMAGAGSVTLGTETAPIQKGDAIPTQLNESKSFENTGADPLELLIIGIVKDAVHKEEYVPRRRAGRGGGGRRGAGRGEAGAKQ
jgi:mannose-6-phosphate isomerase-like protein (cupin superfamily)